MNVTFRAGVVTPPTKPAEPKTTDTGATNVTSTLNPTKSSNVLVDKNYGSLQVKNMKVAFKGLPASLPAGGPSLGEKVTGLFDLLKSNEVILAGSNLKKAMKDLETHVDAISEKTLGSPFKKVIKKIFFVHDQDLKQTLGFTKTDGYKEFTNLSDKMAFIKAGEKNEKYFIKPNDTVYITNTDTLLTDGGKNLKFDTNTKLVPNKVKEKYAMVIDLTDETEPTIKQINKRNLKQFTYDPNQQTKQIMFKDVGGMNDAIQEVKEMIVYPIKHPEVKSAKNMNKAILLEGPPGTGKSLLGEATANESKAYYRYIKGSELDSKFVGESEANVRAVVEEARQNQPAIIFIDEIDAIGKKRDGKDTYGDKVLNTWLAEMSESEKRGDDIYFIAATNNKGVLDGAMTRAGRFGKIIHIGEPDLEGTKKILDIHTKGIPLAENFDKAKYAGEFHKRKAVGADIAAAVEDAERFAKRREGIYEKIENGTYKPEDMQNLRIKQEDFDKALIEIEKRNEQHKAAPRPQIGYNADRYKK